MICVLIYATLPYSNACKHTSFKFRAPSGRVDIMVLHNLSFYYYLTFDCLPSISVLVPLLRHTNSLSYFFFGLYCHKYTLWVSDSSNLLSSLYIPAHMHKIMKRYKLCKHVTYFQLIHLHYRAFKTYCHLCSFFIKNSFFNIWLIFQFPYLSILFITRSLIFQIKNSNLYAIFIHNIYNSLSKYLFTNVSLLSNMMNLLTLSTNWWTPDIGKQ